MLKYIYKSYSFSIFAKKCLRLVRKSVDFSLSLSHTHTHTHTYTHARAHTHTRIYIYIYIYIWLNIIDVFCLLIFFVNPFKLPYWSYYIRLELVDKSSMISYFPSTFCPTLSHHQGRMYYKSDATFVRTLLLCKKRSVCTVVLCSVYL